MDNYEKLIERSAPMPDAMRAASDLCGIFYTGGTTGRSKGVMLSHGNLMVNALHSLGEGLFPGTALFICTPRRCSTSPMARRCIRCLLSGGSNVIIQGFTPDGVPAPCRRTASPTCCWCRP